MNKAISLLLCVAIILGTYGCGTKREVTSDAGFAEIPQLPLRVVETTDYRLSLVDAYIYEDDSHDDEPKYSYVFKFEFENKHPSSNIRAALVNAEVNGYSLRGSNTDRTDTSFSVYTWSGHNSDNTALGVFTLAFEDIEAMTNVRDAKKIDGADLSFTFRVYVIDEMDDYGEDMYYTIDDAFLYCYQY